MSLKRHRTHQPTPFQLKKEIRWGEISEKGKGGGWWGASALRRTGGAAQIAILAEIGSDFGVKSHQISTNSETVALSGGFFGGGAQRLPAVFQGGDKKLPRLRRGSFCLSA